MKCRMWDVGCRMWKVAGTLRVHGRADGTRSVPATFSTCSRIPHPTSYILHPTSPRPRRAFSLLEVILAMAILMAAIAILGELMRFGMRNAQAARDKTKAALFCESKLAEIVAGAIPANSVSDTPVEETFDSSDINWTYSIDVQMIDETGLAAVTVTVRQGGPDAQKPIEVSLTRWLTEPASTSTSTDTETTDTSQTAGTSGASGTSGTGAK